MQCRRKKRLVWSALANERWVASDECRLVGLHVIPVDLAECYLAEEEKGGAEFLTVVLLGVGSNVAGADGARRGSGRSQL